MRRLITTLLTVTLAVTLLGAAVARADAADTTKTVRGHDYTIRDFSSPGLTFWDSACGDPLVYNPNRVYVSYRRGGAAGTTQAIGWGSRNDKTGGEFGVLARVPDPATLTTLNAAVDAAGNGRGDLQAFLRGSDGWYVGDVGLIANVNGWGEWDNLATVSLGWRYQKDDGTITDFSATGTIQEIATAHPEVTFARVGLLFGCNGEQYDIDDLRIGTAAGLTTYDFQGLGRSTAHVSAWIPAKRKWLRDAQSGWLDYGGAAYVGGDATLDRTGNYYFDYGRLFMRRYGSSDWKPAGKERLFTEKTYAVYKVRPTRRTAYRFATAGIAADESVSKAFVIDVRARLRAHADRGKVQQGQRIDVTGSYAPRNKGVRVALERKSGARWHTIARDRTSPRATFGFHPRASSVGKWVLRVVAANGGGNLGNQTGRFVVQVTPKPDPPAPCGAACDTSTPDPASTGTAPPDDPQPDDGIPPVFRHPASKTPAQHHADSAVSLQFPSVPVARQTAH